MVFCYSSPNWDNLNQQIVSFQTIPVTSLAYLPFLTPLPGHNQNGWKLHEENDSSWLISLYINSVKCQIGIQFGLAVRFWFFVSWLSSSYRWWSQLFSSLHNSPPPSPNPVHSWEFRTQTRTPSSPHHKIHKCPHCIPSCPQLSFHSPALWNPPLACSLG